MKPDYALSRPLDDPKLRAISLGAGVQSTVVALMAAAGEIGPMPDLAIFADTAWEPVAVYEHLKWLTDQLPFPVHVVKAKRNLRESIAELSPSGTYMRVDIPAYVGVDGKPGGAVNRSCTRDFKIKPIHRELRRLTSLTGKRSPTSPVVEQWIGISTDEIQRMKDSREGWVHHRFPLIEMGMSRAACESWFRARYPGRLLAKSACIGCPFHSREEWAAVQADPVQWADAVEIDDRLRVPINGKTPRNVGQLFLHRSCRPLRDLDFSAPDTIDRDLFDGGMMNECEGMCGV